MKKLMILSCALAVLAVCADEVPEVSGITMTQGSGSRLVTITYNIANAPAVVTLDIQTNATDGAWASIGGENIQNVTGDVWKKVDVGAHEITWRPDISWPNHKIAEGGARAVVTAWSVDNPPDYMVIDLSTTGGAGTELYYPAVEFLPGGILGNKDYRLGKLVMRKISAKDVKWQMGAAPTEDGYIEKTEKLREVMLSDNYYIGVFETTQTQYGLVQTEYAKSSAPYNKGAMFPMELVCYNELRVSEASTASNSNYDYPHDPYERSFIGLLRAKTGLRFDLPSEAQWEFACRAGNGSGLWGDGSPINIADEKDSSLDALGCYSNATTVAVGSYKPNDWGLYDMHGNVIELCLDLYQEDITGNVKGEVVTSGSAHVTRGGRYNIGASSCRSACRTASTAASSLTRSFLGFRLVITPGSNGSFHVE